MKQVCKCYRSSALKFDVKKKKPYLDTGFIVSFFGYPYIGERNRKKPETLVIPKAWLSILSIFKKRDSHFTHKKLCQGFSYINNPFSFMLWGAMSFMWLFNKRIWEPVMSVTLINATSMLVCTCIYILPMSSHITNLFWKDPREDNLVIKHITGCRIRQCLYACLSWVFCLTGWMKILTSNWRWPL